MRKLGLIGGMSWVSTRTYYECITLFTYHLPWLAGEDLELVMGRALCNWLAWPLSG